MQSRGSPHNVTQPQILLVISKKPADCFSTGKNNMLLQRRPRHCFHSQLRDLPQFPNPQTYSEALSYFPAAVLPWLKEPAEFLEASSPGAQHLPRWAPVHLALSSGVHYINRNDTADGRGAFCEILRILYTPQSATLVKSDISKIQSPFNCLCVSKSLGFALPHLKYFLSKNKGCMFWLFQINAKISSVLLSFLFIFSFSISL